MNALPAFAIVLSVAVATYVMRASLILLLAERTLPPVVERSLRYVGPAVLAALTVSFAAGSSDGGPPSIAFPEAAALVIAGGVAWRSKNLILTLLVGMVTLWVLTWMGR